MRQPRFLFRLFLVALSILVLAFPARAETQVARVLRIDSGDTLTVQDAGNRQLHLKLAGIAAPQRLQSYGSRAQANLGALLAGQEIEVIAQSRLSEGRLLARVLVAPPGAACRQQPGCPKTLDAGLRQVQDGMAWWHPAGVPMVDAALYEQAEFEAKIRRRGLWSETNPTPPWRWPH